MAYLGWNSGGRMIRQTTETVCVSVLFYCIFFPRFLDGDWRLKWKSKPERKGTASVTASESRSRYRAPVTELQFFPWNRLCYVSEQRWAWPFFIPVERKEHPPPPGCSAISIHQFPTLDALLTLLMLDCEVVTLLLCQKELCLNLRFVLKVRKDCVSQYNLKDRE